MRYKVDDKYATCSKCGSKQFELVAQGEWFRGVYCKDCGKLFAWVDKKTAGVFKSHGDYKEYE